MRRGTQGHVAAPRGPAQRAHVARYILYYIMYTYINGSLSSPIWGGSYPSRSSGLINPTILILFLRVGLIPTLYLPCRWRGATRGVGSRGRSIDGRRSRGARTTESDQRHVLNKIIITALIDATWRHHARRSDGDQDHQRSSRARAFFHAL